MLASSRFPAVVLAFGLLAGPAHAATSAAPPSTTVARQGDASLARIEAVVEGFEEQDKIDPPPSGAILFIGSSSIHRWKTLAEDFPQFKIINRGINGSTLAVWVDLIGRLVIPYRPRIIVLGAGTNDLWHGASPEQVAADFKTFVETVRVALPETRIIFLGINPAPSRWSQHEKQQEANRLIQAYIAGQINLTYIELWSVELGPDGLPRPDLFAPDRLHPSPAGFKVRTDVIRPYLN